MKITIRDDDGKKVKQEESSIVLFSTLGEENGKNVSVNVGLIGESTTTELLLMVRSILRIDSVVEALEKVHPLIDLSNDIDNVLDTIEKATKNRAEKESILNHIDVLVNSISGNEGE